MADVPRWESFGGLTTLRREMDRLFERVLGREASSPLGEVEPAIEVAETPAAVIVKAQVPGVSKEHLQVNVTDTAFTIKGEVQEDTTTEDKTYHRREIHSGAFARTITLPTTVQAEHATAQLKDGVVEVTIPKREATTAKDVPIQT
jgi:HSP20 family protein